MACESIVALSRACGAEGIVAGLEKAFIISFQDLKPPAGSTTGEVYTLSAGGLVSAIGVVTAKSFVEVGLLKSSAGLNEALSKDTTKGSAFFTQTFSLVLGDLTAENKKFIETVMNQPVAVIVKSRTGRYYAAGLNGQLEISAIEGGTGVAESDLMGYNLTFSGIDNKLIPAVDPTIIAGLLIAAE